MVKRYIYFMKKNKCTSENSDLLKIDFVDHGLFIEHNYPCPVCQKRPAVWDSTNGNFQPCWGCQDEGWNLVKKGKLATVVMRKLGFLT